jgi:hypothetical protein
MGMLAYITLADATANWHHGSVQCLSGKHLTVYDFLSISKEGFVPVFVKPASEAQLGNVVFNEYAEECQVVTASHRAISVYYERYM